MPCLTYSGSDQAVHLGIVLALTSVWWACAVGVTVVLKVALGSEPDSPDSVWSFPFPLTLTLLANVGTAVACGLLASLASGHGLVDARPRASAVAADDSPHSPQTRIEQPGPPPPPSQHTMLHSSSTEATVQESPGVPDIAAAAAQACARGDFVGCPVPSPIAACGCFSRRRKHGALTHTMPLELEILTEPELLALPFAEDDVAVRPPQLRPHLAHEHFSHMPGAPGSAGFAGPIGPHSHTETGDPLALSSGPADAGANAEPQQDGTHSDAPKSEQHFALITMGLIQGLALGAKNEALLLLSVSTRTMIFSTNVLVVMLMARLFGLEQLKKTKLVAALLLTVGGILQGVATWFRMREGDSQSDEPLGYALAFLALVLDAMRWVLLQAVFAQEASPPAVDGGSSGGEPAQSKAPALSKLDMVSWVMWTTTPVCFGLSIFFEPRGLEHASRHPIGVMGLVALLTLGVMGINIAEFGIVQWTSAVTFNVLSQLHSIPLVMAGVIFFGEQIAPVQVLGFAICLVGALLYSFVKAQEKRMPQAPFGSREHTTIIHGGRENSSAIRGIQMAITVHHPDGHFRQMGCR